MRTWSTLEWIEPFLCSAGTYVLVVGRRQVGCVGVHRVTHPTKAPHLVLGTPRSPTDSRELHVGAKARGNAYFPGEPLRARSHRVGQMSMRTGSPWKSK